MLLDKFPYDTSPRESQKEILSKIDDALNSGYKKIIISAPTGIGKSYIAKTLANAYDRSFIVTSTKQLQDQYIKDFYDLRSIKGMSNFACYQLMDLEKIDSIPQAIRHKLTCDKGQCTKKVDGKTIHSCKYKSKGKDADSKWCLYYEQKSAGLESPQAILNYALYFQLKKFQPELPGVKRELGIFDEAHSIENEIVRFLGLDLWSGYFREVNLESDRYKMETIGEILEMLDSLREGYGTILTDMEQGTLDPDSVQAAQKYTQILKRFERIVDVRNMIEDNQSNFVIQKPELDEYGEFKKISVVPVEISEFAKKYFDSDVQIFMSATIDKNNFSNSLGLSDCAFIDIPHSPFLKENREIEFLNVKYLNNSSSFEDRKQVIDEIDSILQKHANERGLILTSSKKRCYDILKHVSKKQQSRIQIAHSENQDGSTIEEILDMHQNTPNGVLLSSSLWQGIDLKDDLSRFQIIEKCPYLYLGDKRVLIKKNKDQNWYLYHTMMKLLQGFGRSIRNENDYAKTYVLDSSVQRLLQYNKNMVPEAFHDVIYN